jgi:heme/copper-type cytochrome/quinol oxidase subunit 4
MAHADARPTEEEREWRHTALVFLVAALVVALVVVGIYLVAIHGVHEAQHHSVR